MIHNDNNMVCDLETGVCGTSEEEAIQAINLNQTFKKVTLYYATDPICSHCWALEPILNRFIQQYRPYFNIEILMGGLLASWDGFADHANGIQAPSDVAQHWQEVGQHSRMPIDGSLWHSNPIRSSYPPSRLFKVIQQQHPGREHDFLRHAREAVFAFNRNIAEEQVLIEIVDRLGLHGRTLVDTANQEAAQDQLEQDFEQVRQLGVRGFPTIIMVNEKNKGVKIVGARSLDTYVDGLQQMIDEPLQPTAPVPLSQWLQAGHGLFAREIEVMYDIEPDHVQAFIERELVAQSYQLTEMMNELYVRLQVAKA
ncbi:DsbA family protein [Paenibacillus wenxiniae]|uniref:DsbA family protein n=1 Tax=Paenibacillus wenxiniae TaxID=1636843 RepID=A0ABW4RP69_9BACL